MSKLFGIPVSSLAQVLAVLLVLLLAVVVALALRNRVFFRLGVRNAGRRRGRAALIVTGLMLATVIFTASLATGDTLSSSIRSSAVTALGRTDEVIGARGLTQALAVGATATGTRFFPQNDAARIAAAGRASGLVSAVAPVLVWGSAVADTSRSQYEPNVTLFAGDPATLSAFGPMRAGSQTVSLSELKRGQVYLNSKLAAALDAKAGDRVRILTGNRAETSVVRAVVDYQGAATSDYGVLMPLRRAQTLLDKPDLIDGVYVANRGGVGASDQVVRALAPTVAALGLETDKTRLNALNAADTVGAAFVSFFTTFGSFSIAAGILLIFLIFVMLAAERRSELGIARAVGTRRGHLVQMFLYEGATYDLLAALVGAALGVLVAFAMVFALGGVFASIPGFHLTFAVRPTSLVVAYALGVLLTLAVLAFSATRVSRMNIVSAIRDLPDPPATTNRRRKLITSSLIVLLGVAAANSGVGAKNEITLGFGVSLLILGLARLLEAVGANKRAVRTGAGVALIVWFTVPSIHEHLFGAMNVNFGIFILGGLMIVIGATWTIMYNADVLLGALAATLGRVRSLAPVVRMSMAYPLKSLFRTGVTLAMFMLVVFTLVVGAITTGSFNNAFDNVKTFGGGFDVHATASSAAPVLDMAAAVRRSSTLRPLISVVATRSSLPVKARQLDPPREAQNYLVGGLDPSFLAHTSWGFDTWARGYSSPAAVWHALATHPGLAVVDPLAVPRRQNYGFSGSTLKFKLHGLYVEDKGWTPVRVSVLDPQTGRHTTLTVIGVLSDSVPGGMTGI
jgi:putative ABC transport system permease protein